MKNIYRYLLAIFTVVMTLSLVSCEPKEPKPDNTEKEESTTYEFTYFDYQGQHLFRMPVTKWGASIKEVKNWMKDYELAGEEDDQTQGAYFLMYAGSMTEAGTSYTFTDGKLYMASVGLIIDQATLQGEIMPTVATMIGRDEKYNYFYSLNADPNIGVMVTLEEEIEDTETGDIYTIYDLTFMDVKLIKKQ